MRYIILGGTGHVGSAVAKSLLAAGQPVTVIGHDESKREDWQARGADFTVGDARDAASLERAFGLGNRLYLLNPPGSTTGDFDSEEEASVAAIVDAAAAAAPEWAVAHSTYGAQPGEHCGDLTSLYRFERRLAEADVPHIVLRAAYYFTNWDLLLDAVRDSGKLPSTFPADFVMPMVDPVDLGTIGARLLQQPGQGGSPHYVEGPQRYTPADAAAAFSAALGKRVEVVVTPREDFEQTYRAQGFSEAAAKSFACMAATSLDSADKFPDDYERGQITLEAHIRKLVDAD